VHSLAERRECNWRLAVEQGAAELAFQDPNCIRYRWLGDTATPGGAREAAFLADCQEIANLVD
jgi:hypothetical protein